MSARLRIGELARRAGIPAATLRAWERRYGIVDPERTEGGYRLYSDEDERRLRAMVDQITHGLAPAEAAAAVLRGAAAAVPAATDVAALRAELLACLQAFDEPGAHRVLDRAVAAYGVDNLVGELILPVLREAGEGWDRGSVSVGQEHFGSRLLYGRILALGRGWGDGGAPLLLLACAPGEEHDLPLAAFALLMRQRGRRIALLGANTPLETLADTAERLEPARVVLSVTSPAAAGALTAAGRLELGCPVSIAGAGADEELADRLGAELLPAEMLDAAQHLAVTV